MKLFTKFDLSDSHQKVHFFIMIQAILVFTAFLFEAIFEKLVFNFTFFFQVIFFVFLFNFYYRSLKNLYYSFWNISLIFLVFYLFSFFRNSIIMDSSFISLLYFIALALLLVSAYIISSPLYYPRVQWWEYDFRYRPDLRIIIETEGEQHRARLSDLRRGAGCVEMFKHYPIGQSFKVSTEINGKSFNLFARVKSKKEPILGRSIIYGVKFINSDLEEKQRLKLLTNIWNENKNSKIRSKFKEII